MIVVEPQQVDAHVVDALFTEASPVETVLFTPPTSAYMKPASAAPTV